ncbi:hypothetical protein CROQUDRAFT_716066 [Cronartium quercuum f. sp. fusiforme G11]|uniref:Uncharacterized protein n=1 Tax=Cronartium quercuum f. sp. fusiforme G11 TaxID=708437 RepID=A0A9P6NES5_9BASI|nr:hypothetical protein CROQUDRAFT_716066 [Cronartium quercuum f. sp. fusiforme G11]
MVFGLFSSNSSHSQPSRSGYKPIPDDEDEGKGFCRLKVKMEIGCIPSRLDVFDQKSRRIFMVGRWANSDSEPMITIRYADGTLAIRLFTMKRDQYMFDSRSNQNWVRIFLQKGGGDVKPDRWIFRTHKRDYMVLGTKSSSVLNLTSDHEFITVTRLEFLSESEVTWSCTNAISDLQLTCFLSVLMLYYHQRPVSTLHEFVRVPQPDTSAASSNSSPSSSSKDPSFRDSIASVLGNCSNDSSQSLNAPVASTEGSTSPNTQE